MPVVYLCDFQQRSVMPFGVGWFFMQGWPGIIGHGASVALRCWMPVAGPFPLLFSPHPTNPLICEPKKMPCPISKCLLGIGVPLMGKLLRPQFRLYLLGELCWYLSYWQTGVFLPPCTPRTPPVFYGLIFLSPWAAVPLRGVISAFWSLGALYDPWYCLFLRLLTDFTSVSPFLSNRLICTWRGHTFFSP